MSDNRLVFSFMQPIYRIGICAHWPLIRFIVGMNLIPHGYRKLFGGSVEKTAAVFGEIDFPFPFDLFSSLSLTYVVAVTEFFGGILIIVGLLTRLAAAATTIFLATAVYVHFHQGFFWTDHGYEYPLLWGVVCLAIFFRGGGPFSLDSILSKEL